MRNLFILAFIVTVLNSFTQTVPTKKIAQTGKSIPAGYVLKSLNYNQLQAIINKKDNKLYVVNFWATWCKPCVEELPGFMEVNKKYGNNPRFKMVLVSLDPATDAEKIVRPFIKKHNLNANVYILDDNKKMNQWIPAVDKKWTGSIPATALYKNGVKLEFREKQLNKDELIKLIAKYL